MHVDLHVLCCFSLFLSSDLFFFVPHGVALIVQLYGDNKGFDLICKQAGQTRGEMSRGKSGTELQNKTQTLCVISDSFIESFSVLFIYVLRFFKFLFSLYLTRLVPLLVPNTYSKRITHTQFKNQICRLTCKQQDIWKKIQKVKCCMFKNKIKPEYDIEIICKGFCIIYFNGSYFYSKFILAGLT